MKTKKSCIILLALYVLVAVVMLPIRFAAAKDSVVDISVSPKIIPIGETASADIVLKNAPQVYGAEISVSFDANRLEAIDEDETTKAVEIGSGNFFDPSKSFFLQNHADNTAGKIQYVVSLLNPAPSSEGKGVLATVRFKTKTDGEAEISISAAVLGTRDGKTVFPKIGKASVVKIGEIPTIRSVIPYAASLLIIMAVGVIFIIRRMRFRKQQGVLSTV